MSNRRIIFAKRPDGLPSDETFKFETGDIPEPKEGEVLLKTLWISVDPYLRGKMNEGPSYTAPFNVGEPITSGTIAEVVKSNNSKFPVGTIVSNMGPWAEYSVSDGQYMRPVSKDVPLSQYLGTLGMPGATAYFGLFEVLQPKAGETIVVSGAAGAVGSIVSQLAKAHGMYVVGTASTEKIPFLNKLGCFDAVVDYKGADVRAALKAACPKGVDCYFDNTGGEVSDVVVLELLNRFARISVCGQIAAYNGGAKSSSSAAAVSIPMTLLKKSARMQGFIVSDYLPRWPEALSKLTQEYKAGRLVSEETVVQGFDRTPEAFLGLFSGKNTGKMVVKVADPSA
eukprot:TRINITY_DN3113_c0_g3_i1.p1 TRINITY_DN3113_c0_g3~~TRINITY_DN3113_c0_g3_i1.p1  ORF type:complete len:351 (-),score=48.54 TRINITY_DN3113_c0_g3_i1:79-1098(-)